MSESTLPGLPPAVLAAMAKARAAGPLTPAEIADLETSLHPVRVDGSINTLHLDGAMDAAYRADELASLAHERDQALDLVAELETVAASLRAIIAGDASSLEISDVVGSIDGWGKLVVGSTLDWQLLIRHGRPTMAV